MNEQSNLLTVTTPHQTTTLRIPGDAVNRATAHLPDRQRSAIRRLHGHYIEHELSMEETGKLIEVSPTTISLIFRGKYEAKLDAIVKTIENYFDLEDRRSQGRKLQFIETELTRRIWSICQAAVEFQKIAFIFGDEQTGKSESLIAFRDAHNHGNTKYTRMPAGGAMGNYLMELARECHIGENLSVTRLRERTKGAFDDRMLLIVDEADACIKEEGRSQHSIQTIQFIREIFDQRKCGVVICAKNVFRDQMENGVLAKVFRQLKRRRLCSLQLPNAPTQTDLNSFARAYDLAPSSGESRELEKKMISDEGLGMWLTLLRMASKLASERKQRMTWNHVIEAYAGLRALEGKKY